MYDIYIDICVIIEIVHGCNLVNESMTSSVLTFLYVKAS